MAMEDRYLFKAKRVDNGKWTVWNIFSGLYGADIDRSTICQCTGLKDKNGKLVWESDIVRDDNGNIYKASWRDRYYQFSWICVKSDKLPIGAKWDFWSIGNYEVEIIGSAVDNAELLEVGE